jgi:stearoyl-CoA 9-desaturase NADPH oxidoreductase
LARSDLLQALTAPHGVERYLELAMPGFSLQERHAEIFDVRSRAAGSVTLRLSTDEAWRGFEAGQFVPITVEIDGVRRRRCYSPANSQHAGNGELELTVKSHPKGLVSGYLNDAARAGMVLRLGAAAGEFVLPMPRPERLLLISGGSGITPVMSMLRTLCDEGHGAPVTFLHYARHARDVAYGAQLSELARRHTNVRVACVSTRERKGRSRVHLSRAQLSALDRDYRQAEVYVCGPPGLIEATRALWAGDGGENRVHSESFLAPRLMATPGEAGGNVLFALSGVEIASNGVTLLEQAEQAGLSPVFGCRMGICHTCTTHKRAGQVRNINSGELSSCEQEEIQPCVSVPAGDVELDL